MHYVICILIMAVIEYGYYRLAQYKGIGAPVCERSLHTTATPTAGGIVFIAAAAIFACLNMSALTPQWIVMLVGAIVLGIVSFIDDLHPLSAKARLIFQTITVALMVRDFDCANTFTYLAFIFYAVGCINSFNFIDGIRGMLVLYSTVVTASLMYAFATLHAEPQLHISLCITLLCALAVLATYNIPDKLFSGDVGSITIGLFVAWMLLTLINATGDISLITLIAVCIFDTGMTATQRLLNGENILTPHRKHIYQTLAHKWGVPHLAVATSYALTQAAISAIYFAVPASYHTIYLAAVIAVLLILYICIRKSARSGKF